MTRVTLKSTDMFELVRFKQRTRAERHAAWLEQRRHGVGGSDMSTILGLNPFSTPYELWLEKTGRRTPEDIGDKWAVVKGNALEGELRRRFRRLHPEWTVIDGTDISLVSRTHPVMHASLDGFIHDEATDSWGVLEIKTTNANRGRTDWHDDDGNIVAPDYYMAQVTHYMAVTGFTWGYFYADIGESEPVEVRFERDETDITTVIDAAEEFWGYVQRDDMPALTGTDVDLVQSKPPYPEGYEQVEDTDFDQLAALYDSYAHAETDARKAKAKIGERLKAMVGAGREGLVSGGWKAGYHTVHFKAQPARPAKEAYDQRRFAVKPLNERN
ncbi:endonuclease [Bifidobacterium primatium]|uniref:Endonuclease n=2 Tax=Bifidobacterium TaxID=1678 RepID=A0A2M9H6B2_9BIFI|nr:MULTISPECIES: YqaJ viral recombinase family protein [Bifidobacterium]NEG95984.1 endonuclease [Bifidobacterium sp. SMB2]NEH12449.1 endonuclease [Bifidobacterium saimiriisciurei]PJM72362.1 endonuclease [Bifidobacterium primatium]